MPIPLREVTDKQLIGAILSVIVIYLIFRIYTGWYSKYLEKKEKELEENEKIGELY